jgi:hypothetical protein
MNRFRQFLLEAERKEKQEALAKSGYSVYFRLQCFMLCFINQMPDKRSPAMHNLDGSYLGEEPHTPDALTDSNAINDTQKVKKTLARTQTSELSNLQGTFTQQSSDQHPSVASLADLKKAMEKVEENLTYYERSTGRNPQPLQTESFSGFTASLMTAVSRLTIYLKEV